MRIRCAQCNRQVDYHEVWVEPNNTRRIVVACHGEKDEMRLTARELDDLRRDGLIVQIENGEGVAFKTPKLTAA